MQGLVTELKSSLYLGKYCYCFSSLHVLVASCVSYEKRRIALCLLIGSEVVKKVRRIHNHIFEYLILESTTEYRPDFKTKAC